MQFIPARPEMNQLSGCRRMASVSHECLENLNLDGQRRYCSLSFRLAAGNSQPYIPDSSLTSSDLGRSTGAAVDKLPQCRRAVRRGGQHVDVSSSNWPGA